MSRWTDPEAWEALLSAGGCPICRDGGPTSVIAELEASWVVMGEAAPPLPGTCAVFFRRHAVELHELTAEEGAAFMRDAQRVSRALKEASGAVKLNYEVHGNTIPHLHMHLFPRYVGDPFENAPINPRLRPADDRTAAEHAEIRRRLMAALGGASSPDADVG